MNKEEIKTYFYKDEFGNYIISEFEDLGFNLEFEDLNLLTKSLNTIGNHIEKLESQLDIANKKLEEIKEYINKNIRPEYRNGRDNEIYLELNENKLRELLSIIDSKTID